MEATIQCRDREGKKAENGGKRRNEKSGGSHHANGVEGRRREG